jgi:hypothetical protein
MKTPLVFLALLTFCSIVTAQEAAPTPQQLHLLVAKVEDQGILADRMEPHENSTVQDMRLMGSPLLSGQVPAGVSSKGLAAAMEPVWRPSGVLVFVKGNFPGIAQGDKKTVTAIRQGACKIHSATDGETRTIPLYQAQ